MANIISKEKLQSRAKQIWQDILKRECEHEERTDVVSLEQRLVQLERKIAKFRSWNY